MEPENRYSKIEIKNFMSGLKQLNIDDSSDLWSLKNNLEEFKRIIENQGNYIDICLKIEMIEAILQVIENNQIWFENISIKRKNDFIIPDDAESSNKKSRNGKLNEHDKDTVFNCVKNHIENRRNKNYDLIKEKGIGPSKTSPWLYGVNKG